MPLEDHNLSPGLRQSIAVRVALPSEEYEMGALPSILGW
jgi:hypothetical protein